MKTTGIVRKVDELGRIVLPVEIRRLLDIDKGTVEIFADENQVYLRKYSPSCVFCGEDRSLIQFEGKSVCATCIAKLRRLEPEKPE